MQRYENLDKRLKEIEEESLKHVDQNLTEEQQVQARTNIGAASAEEVSKLSEEIADLKQNGTGTGSGATTAQANSLWAFLQKTAFSKQLTDEEITAFKTTWGITDEGTDGGEEPDTPTTYTITRNLTDCTSSSGVTSISEGSVHTETITANSGYTLTGATVSVIMDGSDITSSYSNGVINISSVTGNIVITVSATQETTEPDNPEVTLTSISATYTGGDVTVGTSVNDLTGITVTATYSDGSTTNVTDYTLSGEIIEGSNTITVSYGGKITTFTVTGVTESSGDTTEIINPYVAEGLEIRLDAIDNTLQGHDSTVSKTPWCDISGNGYEVSHPSSMHCTIHDTYITTLVNETHARMQTKVVDYEIILAKLKDGFTFEIVWKPVEDVSTLKRPLVCVGSGESNHLLIMNGTTSVFGSTIFVGTATSSDYSKIKHYTITYDGSALALYHDGQFIASTEASMDLSTGTKLEFLGDHDWAQVVTGCFNAIRVYTRALTAEEILSNYNTDIERFGE